MRKFLQKTALWILLLPVALGVLGTASNQVVLYANHDRFPVTVNLVKAREWAPDAILEDDGTIMLDDIHCIATSKTHLNLLGDIFDFHSRIMSIGDLAQDLGDFIWYPSLFIWGTLILVKVTKE